MSNMKSFDYLVNLVFCLFIMIMLINYTNDYIMCWINVPQYTILVPNAEELAMLMRNVIYWTYTKCGTAMHTPGIYAARAYTCEKYVR
jgi:hypothetical protein